MSKIHPISLVRIAIKGIVLNCPVLTIIITVYSIIGTTFYQVVLEYDITTIGCGTVASVKSIIVVDNSVVDYFDWIGGGTSASSIIKINSVISVIVNVVVGYLQTLINIIKINSI